MAKKKEKAKRRKKEKKQYNYQDLLAKYSLSVEEASAYSGIGQSRLRLMAKELGNDISFRVGKRILFRRQKFVEYLDTRKNL